MSRTAPLGVPWLCVGGSSHYANSQGSFYEYMPVNMVVNGLVVVGIGNISLEVRRSPTEPSSHPIKLVNVLHIPSLSYDGFCPALLNIKLSTPRNNPYGSVSGRGVFYCQRWGNKHACVVLAGDGLDINGEGLGKVLPQHTKNQIAAFAVPAKSTPGSFFFTAAECALYTNTVRVFNLSLDNGAARPLPYSQPVPPSDETASSATSASTPRTRPTRKASTAPRAPKAAAAAAASTDTRDDSHWMENTFRNSPPSSMRAEPPNGYCETCNRANHQNGYAGSPRPLSSQAGPPSLNPGPTFMIDSSYTQDGQRPIINAQNSVNASRNRGNFTLNTTQQNSFQVLATLVPDVCPASVLHPKLHGQSISLAVKGSMPSFEQFYAIREAGVNFGYHRGNTEGFNNGNAQGFENGYATGYVEGQRAGFFEALRQVSRGDPATTQAVIKLKQDNDSLFVQQNEDPASGPLLNSGSHHDSHDADPKLDR